jgi:hypothetical protein
MVTKDESKGLETVEPKGLSEEKAAMLERLSASCDCLCSGNQYAGAKGAGKNSSTCGCYCALNNDNANHNGANVALSSQRTSGIISFLRD